MNEILNDLHDFISALNKPDLFDKDRAISIKSYSQELSTRLSVMTEYFEQKKKSFGNSIFSSLKKMESSLTAYGAELAKEPHKMRNSKLYQPLLENYEEILQNIKNQKITQIKAIHLKPVNYARNLLHITTGISCTVAYQFILTRQQTLILLSAFLVVFGFLEITRRYSTKWNTFLFDTVFKVISRPHERHRINGSTYYVIAMFILAIFFAKPIALIGVLVLGLADPAASVVGKLWGRRKLFKQKSFMGTGAFLIVSFSATLGYLTLAVPSFSIYYSLVVAGAVSLAATVTELFSVKVDDNLSIPIVSAMTAVWFF